MATVQWKNIFEAAANGDENAVRHFVEVQDVPIKSVNEDKQTLAHIAAENTHLNVLKYVLGQEPSLLTQRDNYNNTVLFHAVVGGFLPMVQYLVDELGADIYEPINPSSGNNALHEAADEGRIEILKYLIEGKRADVNSRNHVGETPLFVATAGARLPIVEYLVERANANVTLTDNWNNTVLDVSVKDGDLSIPRYLLDKRKIDWDVNRRNGMGRTIVYLAARNNHLAFLKYFLEEKRADVNICDKVGRSPLHIAAHQGHLRVVKYLIKLGVDPEIKDKFGRTALDMSANDEVTQYLDQIKSSSSRSKRSASTYAHHLSAGFPGLRRLTGARPQISMHSSGATLTRYEAANTLRFDQFLLLALVSTRHVRQRNQPRSIQTVSEFLQNRIENIGLDDLSFELMDF